MPRSKSSSRWLKEHFSDPYVKQAQQAGYRSRAAYKLIEIQKRDRLIRPGMLVIDLGAAPGGWSQLCAEWVGADGRVFALDILPMDPLTGVTMIQGDFREEAMLDTVHQMMEGALADVVLSDMAPNTSGVSSVDQPRAMYLAELALVLAEQVLKAEGSLLVKVFQGVGFDDYVRSLRGCFSKVMTRKPDASRSRSKEVYLLAVGYRKHSNS